jgi:ABC-2 type transport system ATP-binding protein
MTAAIELTGLTKSYGPHRGIEDINLEVQPGRAFGFLGPNGAGKSTTMRVLLDFHRATSGRAAVLGFDCRTESMDVRRRTGYLSGDIAFHERLTAIEQLEWLGRLRGGVPTSRIDELAERLGLDTSRTISELSTGNRQKVGLVQAFMHEPDVLILDEPTSGLDPLVQHTFQEMVRETAAAGRTVFLSSHIIGEIDRACDEVAIIREGKMVTVESIEHLRERSLRQVTITFDVDVDAAEFEHLSGVVDVAASPRTLTLRTQGGVDAIVKHAARHPVVDFVSEQADLEAVFLAFYSGDEQGDGVQVGDDSGDDESC